MASHHDDFLASLVFFVSSLIWCIGCGVLVPIACGWSGWWMLATVPTSLFAWFVVGALLTSIFEAAL